MVSPIAAFNRFCTVDGVFVDLVICCIVFSFAGTRTAITATTSLLFATNCFAVRIGQHHCLQLASNCIHNGLCLLFTLLSL